MIGSVGKLDRGTGFCRHGEIRCLIGSEGKLGFVDTVTFDV